ncbi:hypothetical protein CAP35_06885 [Chitinophagaceae bacterium IBVUCB1]|nr:hypothetical protein CAP35_06885 [Chitinophagaceae bacterium IBVUCB1]
MLLPTLPFFLLAAKERNKEKLPKDNDRKSFGGYLLCCIATVLPSNGLRLTDVIFSTKNFHESGKIIFFQVSVSIKY